MDNATIVTLDASQEIAPESDRTLSQVAAELQSEVWARMASEVSEEIAMFAAYSFKAPRVPTF